MIHKKIAALFGCFVLTGTLCAQVGDETSKRKLLALVIGNSNYKSHLEGPSNDAADMAKALAAIGFTVTNSPNIANVDRKSMFDQVNNFSQKIDSQTVAVIYYSGHGIEDAHKNYLVPTDAIIESYGDIISKLVPLDYLMERMAAREARTVIIILDACRNMPTELKYKTLGQKGGLSEIKNLNPGLRVIYAASPGQVAQAAPRGQRNSVFTGAILKAMGERKNGGFDDIINRAAVLTVDTTGRRQIPYSSGTLGLAWVDSPQVAGNPFSQKQAEDVVQTSRPVKDIPSSMCNVISQQSIVNGVVTWQKKCIVE